MAMVDVRGWGNECRAEQLNVAFSIIVIIFVAKLAHSVRCKYSLTVAAACESKRSTLSFDDKIPQVR